MSASTKKRSPRRSSVPRPHMAELSNGLRVVVLPSHEDPYLSMRLFLPAGSLLDPPGCEGMACCCAQMLRHGTLRWSESELSESLDTMAVRVGASVHQDFVDVGGDCITSDPAAVQLFFDALEEVILRPTFPDQELLKVKGLREGRLKRIRDQNHRLMARAFEMMLFRGHPLGRPLAGTLDSLRSTDPGALRLFHARSYSSRRALLGLAGDITVDQALERAEQHFAGLKPGTGGAEEAAMPSPDQPRGLRVTVIDKADPSLSQVHFRVGHVAPLRLGDPGFFAYRLAAQVLGGDFTARLNQRLRVEEGLTYGAHFNFRASTRLPQGAAVATYVETGKLGAALRLTLDELQRFAELGPTDAEISKAKDKLVLSFPFRFETPADSLDQQLWMQREGLGRGFLESYQEHIDDVSSKDVRSAAAHCFPGPASAEVVVVAGAESLEQIEPLLGPEDQIEVLPVEALGL